MADKAHWERVYTEKKADTVSWYQTHAAISLDLIRRTGISTSAALIDVGGGASTLADDLLQNNFSDITVLDLSAASLRVARTRLGERADLINWLEADITCASLPARRYDLWHDRAVFHFLTDPAERSRYLQAVGQAVRPGGYVIVGTFAGDGPERCSGLPVQRYSVQALNHIFGNGYELLGHEKEDHCTPSGMVQKFIYCCWRRHNQHPGSNGSSEERK